jgi:preprotein translocase subunit SecE
LTIQINSLPGGNGFVYLWHTGVAQLVEHWSPKPGVGRSSRSSRAKRKNMKQIVSYIQESYKELIYKVTWPSWKELQGSAIVVMISSLLIAIVVALMDFGFKNLMSVIYNLFT